MKKTNKIKTVNYHLHDDYFVDVTIINNIEFRVYIYRSLSYSKEFMFSCRDCTIDDILTRVEVTSGFYETKI